MMHDSQTIRIVDDLGRARAHDELDQIVTAARNACHGRLSQNEARPPHSVGINVTANFFPRFTREFFLDFSDSCLPDNTVLSSLRPRDE